jgi:hypothetical protein
MSSVCFARHHEVDGVPLLAPADRDRVGALLIGLRDRKDARQAACALIRSEVFGGAEVDGEMIARAWRLNFRHLRGAR